MYSSSCDIHRFYYAESDPDPVYIHGADARKKKWTVDRIFLWISGRHVLWLCVWSVSYTHLIQAVSLGTPEGLIAFCKGIQAAAPVDSYVDPEPWDMPGYDSQVIMAAGAFVQGSSIELSADGPMKPPYAVYFQGGLTWEHAKLGVLMSLQKMVDKGLVTL